MPQKSNPILVRLDLNHSSDPSRFSDYHYSKSVYQDVNLRSYFSSIRPPTILPLAFVSVGVLFYIFPKGHSFISFFPVDHYD